MDEERVKDILAETEAVLTDDHFVYTKGEHGPVYVNKDAIFPYTEKVSCLCRGIAQQFTSDKVDVIASPAIGAVVLAHWTAHELGSLIGRSVLAVYAEKVDGNGPLEIRRGFDKLIAGRNVLVVEDILNSGGSAADVVRIVQEAGGNVVGVGAICNRGEVTNEDLGVPKLRQLISLTLDKYPEEACPLCAQDVPINTKFGKGREFLERKKLQSQA